MSRLRFPPYSIPDDLDLLFRGSDVIALEPTPVRVLRYLVANHERVVPTQEILDQIWPETFTTESVVKRAIREIRRALDDDPKHARFVETHHRRGYRFIGQVETESAPPRPSAVAPGTNLPHLLTRFVGREALRTEVAELVAVSRLVTLTGLGGMGKTRLAIAAAETAAPEFPGGVWFVDLAAIAEPRNALGAVAATLGVRDDGADPVDAVARVLDGRKALVVLDNCEHVIDAAADAAVALLTTSSDLHVLATSREPLAVHGETVREVPALGLPSEECDSLEQLGAIESARLLLDRMALTSPGFEASDDAARLIARVCRKLEGIPLAIELAAARAGVFTLEELDERLDEPLGFLRGTRRGAPTRQQTLRSTLTWSYELLSPEERTLFGRLSVFSGGFSGEAVSSVFGDVADVEGALDRLVEKSLVQMWRPRTGRRFRLLNVVHSFAAAKLDESGGARTARERHAAWALAAALAAGDDLAAQREGVFERLDSEIENLRAAIAWLSGEGGDPASSLRLTCALWSYWDVRGLWTECRGAVDRALESGVALAPELAAEALRISGLAARRQGDYAKARTALEESLTLARSLGEAARTCRTLQNLAGLLCCVADYRGASARYEEALGLARELGSAVEISASLGGLGHVAADLGEFEVAERYFEQSLDLYRGAEHNVKATIVLRNLAEIARRRGNLERACSLGEEAVARARALGQRSVVAHACEALGSALIESGDVPRAATLLAEALEVDLEIGDRLHLAFVLEALVCLGSSTGEHRRALRLAGAATALREAIGSPLPEGDRVTLDRFIAASRDAVGEDAETESAHGAAMRTDDVAALARALAREAELRSPDGWRRKPARKRAR